MTRVPLSPPPVLLTRWTRGESMFLFNAGTAHHQHGHPHSPYNLDSSTPFPFCPSAHNPSNPPSISILTSAPVAQNPLCNHSVRVWVPHSGGHLALLAQKVTKNAPLLQEGVASKAIPARGSGGFLFSSQMENGLLVDRLVKTLQILLWEQSTVFLTRGRYQSETTAPPLPSPNRLKCPSLIARHLRRCT